MSHASLMRRGGGRGAVEMRCAVLVAALSVGAIAACTEGAISNDQETTCGDGVCSLADSEHCEVCPADCGECGACGDGTCDTGVESCDECPQDCGACAACGDGTCSDEAGEDCSTCQEDCGACLGCGDGVCDGAAAESCDSCAADCGACQACGDGDCDATQNEDCSTCEADCGACNPCGDGECDPDREDCQSCAADCGACSQRGGCVQGKFDVFWGNLHAHTHYSDGQATPGEAFAHARKAGLDFMWITDHRGMLTRAEWDACRRQADTANAPGTYVTGCGYETTIMNSGGAKLGHLNTLFTGKLLARPTGLAALYQALAGCKPCVGQWNHPPWPGTFNDYQYFGAGVDAMRLIEFNGHGAWDAKWKAYFTALRNGWLVSASVNEDNHSRNWGDSKRATGVWATKLGRTEIRQAARARRTFATFDDTASIKLLADDVCFMGSVLRGLGDTELKVVARDKQANDGFKRIELYGPNGNAIATHACKDTTPCTAKFARKVAQETFFVAKAIQTDGDVLVSGPIWFKP